MATVVELRPNEKQEFTASLGMIIFLASWGMMFSALFFAYGFVRARSLMWPPPGAPELPILLPAINTGILLVSSLTFARGLSELKRGRKGALTAWVSATIALGSLFLGLQWVVWRSVADAGLHFSTGIYGSVFYGLTVLHAVHVAAGLLVLLWVLFKSLRGAYTPHNFVNIRLCTMFWHFVDVVWVLMFVTIYLL
jgi:cytochrome c oxidase subunit 3